MINLIQMTLIEGFTITCGGFYGSQGRIHPFKCLSLRIILVKLRRLSTKNYSATNLEMETANYLCNV